MAVTKKARPRGRAFLMTSRSMKFDPVARKHVAYKEANIK
jgi:ribosomal protein L33